jgi:hypothetical protein
MENKPAFCQTTQKKAPHLMFFQCAGQKSFIAPTRFVLRGNDVPNSIYAWTRRGLSRLPHLAIRRRIRETQARNNRIRQFSAG